MPDTRTRTGLLLGPWVSGVIIMASYRIGPFDVESVLVTHDQVIEAAVIGVPDQLRGEVIEAFVVLRHPARAPKNLWANSSSWSSTPAYAYPRRVHFVEALPKTPAARFSDTSFAGHVPDPLRRDTARLSCHTGGLYADAQAITAMVLAERLGAGYGDDDLFVVGCASSWGCRLAPGAIKATSSPSTYSSTATPLRRLPRGRGGAARRAQRPQLDSGEESFETFLAQRGLNARSLAVEVVGA